MAKIKLFLTLSLFSFVALAGTPCELKPEKFNELMHQDFDTFDQKPIGWRSLDKNDGSCNLTIALIIDSYLLNHQSKLLASQIRLLHWHTGQNFGFLNLYALAIAKFNNSFDPQESQNPEFHWNAYARATIAFMKKDKAALQKALDEFTVVSPMEVPNLKIVERFIRCFDAPYFDAYTGTGACE